MSCVISTPHSALRVIVRTHMNDTVGHGNIGSNDPCSRTSSRQVFPGGVIRKDQSLSSGSDEVGSKVDSRGIRNGPIQNLPSSVLFSFLFHPDCLNE